MSKKSNQERKAQRDINKELKEITELANIAAEQRIEAMDSDVKEVMAEIAEEEKIQSYYDGLGRYDLLKAKMIRMFCSGLYTQTQIARTLRVTPQTISNWLADEDVREVIERVQADEDSIMAAQLRSIRRIAIEKQLELIQNTENEMVSAVLIRDVLDRTGHKPVEKQEVQHNITYEERIQQLAQGIEVDYTVVDDGIDANSNQMNTEGDE